MHKYGSRKFGISPSYVHSLSCKLHNNNPTSLTRFYMITTKQSGLRCVLSYQILFILLYMQKWLQETFVCIFLFRDINNASNYQPIAIYLSLLTAFTSDFTSFLIHLPFLFFIQRNTSLQLLFFSSAVIDSLTYTLLSRFRCFTLQILKNYTDLLCHF